jgi:hypothetical protein
VNLPGTVEAVLMASNPEMHIDSLRPAVRVVMSDAVRQFAGSLLQARPVLNPELINKVTDRITTPRPKSAAAEPEPEPEESYPVMPAAEPAQVPSRARAIFHAAEESKPFDPTDLSFAFDENAANAEGDIPKNLRETSPSQRRPLLTPRRALSAGQLLLLGVMLVVECCVVGGFAYLILSNR